MKKELSKNKEIIIHDNKIKVKQEKTHLLLGFGVILIITGVISTKYMGGKYGINAIWVWAFFIVGILMIVFDFITQIKE
ncbi:MAG: hypothetical protein WC916_03380 [Candidatus Woesearchaeota archaeon]